MARVKRGQSEAELAPLCSGTLLNPPGAAGPEPLWKVWKNLWRRIGSTVAFPRVPSRSWIGCSCPELYNCDLNACNRVLLLWKRRRIGHCHPSNALLCFSENLWVFPRFGVLKIIPMCVDFRPRFSFLSFPTLVRLTTLSMLSVCRENFPSVVLYLGNNVLVLLCFVLF